MSNYRRLISYIYAYEGGIKGKNIGFAKLENRNGQCRIQVSVRNIYVGGQDTGVYLLTPNKELLIGKMFLRGGAGEFRTSVPIDNVADSGQTIDQCYGLSIHGTEDSWQSYTTIWEDAVAHAAEVELSEVTSEKVEEREMQRVPSSSITEKKLEEVVTNHKSSIVENIEAEIQAQLEKEKAQKREERKAFEEPAAEIIPSTLVQPKEEEPQHFPWPKAPEEVDNSQLQQQKGQTKQPEESQEEKLLAESQTEKLEPMKPETYMGQKGFPLHSISPQMIPLVNDQPKPAPPQQRQLQPIPPQEDLPPQDQPRQNQTPQSQLQPVMPQQTSQPVPPQSASIWELKQESQLKQLEQEEQNEELEIDKLWQYFCRTYPKIQAFDYKGGCEILTIKPQDIGLLPRETWGYGNNSFLLHGYYNHRYLILARLSAPKGGVRFLLGVPGHYYSNEKYMASMFGFPNFVLSKMQPSSDGRFGYWYTDIRLNTTL